MTISETLLIFLGRDGGFDGWLHLADGEVRARGAALHGLPEVADEDESRRIVAVVPGEAVALHWIELPDTLSPAQAVAAARLGAEELSAQSVADLHVAVGESGESGLRMIATVPALAMIDWLGRLQSLALDPEAIVPETLLVNPPEHGFRRFDDATLPLYRSRSDAFALEPEIAAPILRGAPVEIVGRAEFEAGLSEAIAAMPINLRQGAFARRRRWAIDWPLVRRLALIGAAILFVTLAIQVAAILRYDFAADRLERQAAAVAAEALPGERSGDPIAALTLRLAERGGGMAQTALAAILFESVRDTPNVEVSALSFDRPGTLVATVIGDMPATIAALSSRIEARGLRVATGASQAAGGRQSSELTVSAP